MADNQEYKLKPTKCVYGGDALARLPDGRAVFIPYGLPGDELLVRLVEEKERYARAEILQILSPSPERIRPRCKHFGDCGGCHYQHLDYQEQLKVKHAILIDQLQRVGKIPDPPVQPILASPSAWEYRNQIQFHLSDEGKLGFHRHRSSQVVPVEECFLPEPGLGEIWPEISLDQIPGLDRVILRSGDGGEDTLIVLESSQPSPVEFKVDLPLSAVHAGPGGELVLAGDDFVVIPVKEIPFVSSATAFFQTNTRAAELMVDALLDMLPLTRESLVLDLYCGGGLFSAFLAPRVGRLIGIESHPAAGEDFLYNLAGNDRVEFYDQSVEDVLPYLDLQPDIILADPPRSGLSRSVLDRVVQLAPALLVYISCDPATMARDARRLIQQGYDLISSTPVDMFPQTYHIESVNLFQRAVAGV